MSNKKPSTVKTILRAIVNSQTSMKEEILQEFKKVHKRIDDLETRVDEGFIRVNNRLDSIGKCTAYLEDDAPTNKEQDKLVKRVTKIEKKLLLA